jgi:aspartate kinase
MPNKTLVMKFGGASVASLEQFDSIADIILERRKTFDEITVVISAMGDTTTRLIEMAHQVHPNPPQREYDMLITVGERISCSLLAMALQKKGQPAISFTGSQAGIITNSEHTNAKIIGLRPHRLRKSLSLGKITVIAGFQGVSEEGDITTLGRGGSDTSAVVLGVGLEASHIEFYKDVGGIYTEDPKVNKAASLLPHLTFEEALEIMLKGSKILHPRSVALALTNSMPLHIFSFQDFTETSFPGTVISSSVQVQYKDTATTPHHFE